MILIQIVNSGPLIASTDYWDTEHASAGLLYLSGNAGVWRLLVPGAAESMLSEMRTGKRAVIERSAHPGAHAAGWDVVFDDGTAAPFSVSLSPGQIDRGVQTGISRLVVWTQRGPAGIDLKCTDFGGRE